MKYLKIIGLLSLFFVIATIVSLNGMWYWEDNEIVSFLKEYTEKYTAGESEDSVVSLNSAEKNLVAAGGASLGIIIGTDGVMVVGYSALENTSGETVYPAKDGGIAIGDFILKINDVVVTGDNNLLELVDTMGKNGALTFEIRHGEKIYRKNINPLFCKETGRYRVGLYVRDQLGGIGTLTFYDPATKRFAALGHTIEGVTESSNGVLGKALPSEIQGIRKASKGEVGEKIGSFTEGDFSGNIDKIGKYGIYGVLEGNFDSSFENYLPLAKADEITKGKAEIITVLGGGETRTFFC